MMRISQINKKLYNRFGDGISLVRSPNGRNAYFYFVGDIASRFYSTILSGSNKISDFDYYFIQDEVERRIKESG